MIGVNRTSCMCCLVLGMAVWLGAGVRAAGDGEENHGNGAGNIDRGE